MGQETSDFGSDLDHYLDHLDPGFFKGSYIDDSQGIELPLWKSELYECSCYNYINWFYKYFICII